MSREDLEGLVDKITEKGLQGERLEE